MIPFEKNRQQLLAMGIRLFNRYKKSKSSAEIKTLYSKKNIRTKIKQSKVFFDFFEINNHKIRLLFIENSFGKFTCKFTINGSYFKTSRNTLSRTSIKILLFELITRIFYFTYRIQAEEVNVTVEQKGHKNKLPLGRIRIFLCIAEVCIFLLKEKDLQYKLETEEKNKIGCNYTLYVKKVQS